METHGWLEPLPDAYKMHRGQFGKLRSNGVYRNLYYVRVVQLGWCAFAANGDVLHRQELCVCDAPPCHQKAIDVHGLTDAVLAERGVPLTEALRHFAVALQTLQRDGGVLVAHLLENDVGLLQCEYQRVGAISDAALLAALATDSVCTMQAAAAQQRLAVRPSRTYAQLRNSFNFNLIAINLAAACRMYGVAMPEESDSYRAHAAMYDAELAGRLYLAMRGIAYATAPARPLLSIPRRLHRPAASAPTPHP